MRGYQGVAYSKGIKLSSGYQSPKELLKSTTPVNGPSGPAPLFETNLAETLGIRKFLIMSLEDVRAQLAAAAENPQITRRHFAAMKANALVITAWLTSALEMVDCMLGAAAPQTEQETEQ